ncbi:MAG: TIGR02530 family flagellar biosynthesis protein [Oligoflexia bacterium]|nr:TIGR02530 family flagellar biosynthesis protein [Oligoflexia bacterium]
MSNGPILYPNVTSLPGQGGVGQSDRLPRKQEGAPGEFDQVFGEALSSTNPATTNPGSHGLTTARPDLSQIKAPLKFSAHASQRLQDRKIALDTGTMTKVNEAVDKAEAKGLDDALILTKDAALIVSVKNRTVITAVDRNSMTGNVFTNIDGAVIV